MGKKIIIFICFTINISLQSQIESENHWDIIQDHDTTPIINQPSKTLLDLQQHNLNRTQSNKLNTQSSFASQPTSESTQGVKLDIIHNKAQTHYKKNALLTEMSTNRYMKRVNELSNTTQKLISDWHQGKLANLNPKQATSYLTTINNELIIQEKKWNLGILGDRSQHLINNLKAIKSILLTKQNQFTTEEREQMLNQLTLSESEKKELEELNRPIREEQAQLDTQQKARENKAMQINTEEESKKQAKREQAKKIYQDKQAAEDAAYQAHQESLAKANKDEYQRITAENEKRFKAEQQKIIDQKNSKQTAAIESEKLSTFENKKTQRKTQEKEQHKQSELDAQRQQVETEKQKNDLQEKITQRALEKEKARQFNEKINTAYAKIQTSAQQAAEQAQKLSEQKTQTLQKNLLQVQDQLSKLENSKEYKKIYTIHDIAMKKQELELMLKEIEDKAHKLQEQITKINLQRANKQNQILSNLTTNEQSTTIKNLQKEMNDLLNNKQFSILKEQIDQQEKALKKAYTQNNLTPESARNQYLQIRDQHSKLFNTINRINTALKERGTTSSTTEASHTTASTKGKVIRKKIIKK